MPLITDPHLIACMSATVAVLFVVHLHHRAAAAAAAAVARVRRTLPDCRRLRRRRS
jgi:hypothetical protein